MMLQKYAQQIIGICLTSLVFTSSCGQSYTQKNGEPDSVRAAVSTQYNDPGLLKMVFLGNNYREEWATTVTFPQFDLSSTGMRITGLGGGWQTKSLQLIDRDSTQWVLRTVDKDLANGVPERYRNWLYITVMQDMVSAAHPYAPLVITGLAKATNVPSTDPVYYYVPDDTAFGEYKEFFAGKVCMLERREVIAGDPVTVSTTQMLDEFMNSGYSAVDMKAYLRARLLDMLIADWDRHQDQWIWSEETRNGNKTFVALPKDRDQAFFHSQGLLVKMMPIAGYKHFVGLQRHTRKIRNLNAKSWNLDRLMLNGLDKNESQAIVDAFVAALPDSTIRLAVKRLPPEIYSIRGHRLEKKLIKRKQTLAADAMKYLDFISETVVLYGTDQADQFIIEGSKDSITISVSRDGIVHLNRTFFPGQTKQITLHGFGGNDQFTLKGEIPTAVVIEMNGGTGTNSYAEVNSNMVRKYDSDMTVEKYRPLLHRQLRITPE